MIRYVSPASYSELTIEQLRERLIKNLTELDTLIQRCSDEERYEMTWNGAGNDRFNRLTQVVSGKSPIGIELNAVPELNGKQLRGIEFSMTTKLIAGQRCAVRLVESASNMVMPRTVFEVAQYNPEERHGFIPWDEVNGRLKGKIRIEPECMPEQYGSKCSVYGFSCALVYGDLPSL